MRTVRIAVRALRAAVLAMDRLGVVGIVPIVPAVVRVGTTIDVPAAILTPTDLVRRVTTMTVDLVVLSGIHRLQVRNVPTNLEIIALHETLTGTMTALAGRLPMATVVPPAMTIAAHHVPTAVMTVALRVMVAPARLVRSPVANAVGHEMVAFVHLDGSLMIVAELHGVTMTAAHHVPTAVMTAALRVMVGLVHHVVNLMTAVVVLVAPARREPVRPVVTTTALHVIVGAKIVPRHRDHLGTNHARAFNVMTPGLALIEKNLDHGLTAMTAHAVVVPPTGIAVSAHSRRKSKSGSMLRELRSLVVGVA